MSEGARGGRAETDVLIVGAGPTGLTLACELARRGVGFRLVEAAAEPQAGSRGKGVSPRTLEVFDDLGIVDRILAHGRVGMPIHSTSSDGRVTVSGAETPALRPDTPYPAALITPEWRIEEALRARLAAFGGAVAFGQRLQRFEQADGGVEALLATESGDETITARWLVGCDGGHSTVRKTAGIAFEGDTRDDVRMIVADVAVDGLDCEAWHMWQHADGFAALCPLPSTDAFQFQAGIAPGQDPALTLSNMQSLLERRSGRSDIALARPSWSSLWRANVRLAARYRNGAVFLAGDAAHIHSPAGGQGMNTGIQDARNLGWKLAAVAGGASPDLLDSYEAERRPVAATVLALSDARLRQAIEQKAIPTARDARLSQLGVTYRGTPLSRDDRGEASRLRAGDRAPDATALLTADGALRLFDITRGGRFTVLNFGPRLAGDTFPAPARVLTVVDALSASSDVVDRQGHLAAAYGPTDRTLVLIRPDGYVASISDAGDAAALRAHLATMS